VILVIFSAHCSPTRPPGRSIGAYYVFVDVCLVIQWVWYERLRHGHPVLRIRRGKYHESSNEGAGGALESSNIEHVVIEGLSVLSRTPSPQDTSTASQAKPATRPKIIFRAPTFQRDSEGEEKPVTSPAATPSGRHTIRRVGPSFPLPSPSPRTVLLIACLVAIVHASPLSPTTAAVTPLKRKENVFSTSAEPTPLEQAGTVLSWFSTLLYLSSRLPQLVKNWRRKSTAGLSAHLFIAAFLGNLFYSAALLTNPSAWYSFDPYGGGGWAGPEGSDRATWVLAALPFFLGAAGVLGLDGTMGLQFLMYGDAHQKLLVVDDESDLARLRTAARSNAHLSAPRALSQAPHWRRVSGWMRGWIPSVSEQGGSREHQALIVHAHPDTGMLEGQARGDAGYGTM